MSLNDKLSKKSKEVESPKIELEPWILTLPCVPAPLHGTAPRVVLGQKWWDKTRKAAYSKKLYHCWICGEHISRVKGSQKHLEGHEIYRIEYHLGLMHYSHTCAACPWCHKFCHRGRLRFLLDSGRINHGTYRAIIQHGNSILTAAGLELPKDAPHKCPDWGKWRLVIGKKKYKGLFKSQKEWEDYHAAKDDED